jgi:hypothetical protein
LKKITTIKYLARLRRKKKKKTQSQRWRRRHYKKTELVEVSPDFTAVAYKTFKEQVSILQLLQKIEQEGALQLSHPRPTI